MAIRVSYVDTITKTELAQFEVSDEAIKALSTDMVSSIPAVVFLDWHMNTIQNKERQIVDELCEAALADGSEKVEALTDAAKQQVVAELNNAGYILPPPVKQMPPSIKHEIIKAAKIKTAAERQAEFEAGLP